MTVRLASITHRDQNAPKTEPALAFATQNKLLNGVAPSGSTRKRREEEEARRQAAMIEARTGSAPSGQSASDIHSL